MLSEDELRCKTSLCAPWPGANLLDVRRSRRIPLDGERAAPGLRAAAAAGTGLRVQGAEVAITTASSYKQEKQEFIDDQSILSR
jgi:hypothetical protein